MSISMCQRLGVPTVSTMYRAAAASSIRSESRSPPLPSTRSSSSWVPSSWNGITPARHALEPLRVLVDPDRVEAAVREAERERQTDPTEPDDGDVLLERLSVGSGHGARIGGLP